MEGINMFNAEEKPHAILVSFPLQGHVIPAIHLAIKLASRGFTITFINTHHIHHKIAAGAQDTGSDGGGSEGVGAVQPVENIFSNVRKSGLDIRYMTVTDGLPIGFDRSLNHEQFMVALLHVFSAHAEEAIEKVVRLEPKVKCLIADTFFVWPGKLAKKYGLSYVSFWTEAALVFTLYYHMDLLRLNGHIGCLDMREDTVDYIHGVQSIEPKDMMSYLQDIDTSSSNHKLIFTAFEDAKSAEYVICNTVQELEQQTISALQEKIKFYAVGPIFPPGFGDCGVSTSLWAETDCSHWLDTKPRGSVLYISFGSYAHIKKNDLIEIANGLLKSKVYFIWVLRPDLVSSIDTNPLPKGFAEATRERAVIIPWCCQRQVLSHPGIGGFLTHCGWNSTLESIWCQVPMLCFPLFTDQFTNRKLIVDDWKIGANLCDRKPITELEVSQKITELMRGKSGEELRKAIKEVKKTLDRAADGSSERNMDLFIEDFKVSLQEKGRGA